MKILISGYLLITLELAVLAYALDNVKFNTMLEGQTINIIPGVGLDECWTNCEQRAACGSINYERNSHLCYLNSPEQTSDMTEQVGMIFREKSAQSDIVKCGKKKCSKGKVCDLTSEKCNVEECEPLQQMPGVDILGNMLSIGSKKIVRCREGFIPTENNKFSNEAVCEQDGWRNMQLECVPLTCKGLAKIGILESNFYNAYDEGSLRIIQIYCEFISGSKLGYSFLSHTTLNPSVNITPYYNVRDHVMLRFSRERNQFESKMQVLPMWREKYNVSVFNSNNPDFSGPTKVTKPYLFIGFIPISFGDHMGHIKGYTCNGINYTFKNSDKNPSNYFAIFQSENTIRNGYRDTSVRDGWKDCSRPVEPTSRYIPDKALYNSYEIGMGGDGCLVRNDDTTIDGLAFGLPFVY